MLRRCGGCVAALFLLQESGIIQSARAINEAKIVIVLGGWPKRASWLDSLGIPRVILASCPRPARDPKKKVGTICALGFDPEKAAGFLLVFVGFRWFHLVWVGFSVPHSDDVASAGSKVRPEKRPAR